MPFSTIRDPGIKQGFSILADAFVPDVSGLIAADLNAKRRDHILAQTQGQNLKNTQTQGYLTATRNLQDLLAKNPDLALPENRASLMSTLAGMEDGLTAGPKFAMGAAGFIQPDFLPPDQFANALQSTGVVTDYGNTQSGLERQIAGDLDEALRVQQLKNASELEQLEFKAANPSVTTGGALPVVDLKRADELYNAVLDQLRTQNPGLDVDDPKSFPPAAQQQIREQVARKFQITRDAQAAVSGVLSEVAPAVSSREYTWADSWNPFGPDSVPAIDPAKLASRGATQSAPAPASAAPAAAPAPAQVPTSIPVPEGMTVAEGEVVRLKSTGQTFRRVGDKLELVE